MVASTAIAQRMTQRSRTPNAAVTTMLTTALAGPSGEYAAYSTYKAVIDKLGPVQPFVNILNAELKHIAALTTQMQKYGVSVPANPWTNIEVPDNLVDAALLGVQIEEDNILMYNQLIADAAAYPDLVKVFTNLQSASEDNHLPAFEAVAEGTVSSTTCPLGTLSPASKGSCAMQASAGCGLQSGAGQMMGNGNGYRRGFRDGTGPRSISGTCPLQTTAATE